MNQLDIIIFLQGYGEINRIIYESIKNRGCKKLLLLYVVTVAEIIAEIGDINRFQDARQIQKYAGLNLVERCRQNEEI
jgi:transposase